MPEVFTPDGVFAERRIEYAQEAGIAVDALYIHRIRKVIEGAFAGIGSADGRPEIIAHNRLIGFGICRAAVIGERAAIDNRPAVAPARDKVDEVAGKRHGHRKVTVGKVAAVAA